MKRLKILLLTRLFPSTAFPTLGTFCFERAKALAQHADVRVMVPTPYFPRGLPAPPAWRLWAEVEREREFESGIRATYPRYLSIPKAPTFLQGLAMARCVRKEMKHAHEGWMPDLIDGHFAFPDGYAAVRLGESIGCSTFVTCHGADLRVYHDDIFVGRMLQRTLGAAAKVLSVSSDLRRRSIEHGCRDENALFLTNGVDPAKFALRSKAECRERLGLPMDRKIVANVGYLIDRKNQSLAIRATDEIRRRGLPPPLLALVGDGPNRQRLEREVVSLDMGQHVVFAGPCAHEEVALWMGAADWLLLTSDYEGWPTVYFEALACGRPVITSNVHSAKDAICKPEYGVVVEPPSPEAFATAMLEAAARNYDPGQIRAYAEDHSWERWAEQALGIFERALANKATLTPRVN